MPDASIPLHHVLPEQRQALAEVTHLLLDLYQLANPMLLTHGRNLAKLSESLARHLVWPEEAVRAVFLGALFHDVGYLATPLDLVGSPLPPDHRPPDMETEHPLLGARLLSRVEVLRDIIPVVRHHHEHLDGSGFPDGLKGEAIPPAARLVGVVHAYQNLRHGYGPTPALGDQAAREVIQEDAGLLWDPAMVRGLLEILGPVAPDEPDESQLG
ncbi:MAG: HD domain-containing protein [Desulfarculus sp.]|nr:HD domain-containing protein [Desulfarculus sp.]